jgi:sirohydrochlorin cobaltochelatase
MIRSALVLFSHGARDPRWAAPFFRLQELIQSQNPGTAVELAFLELMSPGLPDAVKRLADAGCTEVTVVPMFFGQGGHVLRDLPILVEQLKQDYPGLRIRVAPAVGESTEVLNALAHYCIGVSSNPE